MSKTNKDSYDVIIIGAGISGLVCGCYLAKAGMKVLIVEQHHKPGGYCTSFKRNGFTFDAAAHSFGSYRDGGHVKKILCDLNLDKKIKVTRHNPSDIIVTPDFNIAFLNDTNKTIKNLAQLFPQEKENIQRFFSYLTSISKEEFMKLRNKTFGDILDSFFTNTKLINAISLPILGNSGLPPSLLSAFTGLSLFREFLVDGGYYTEEGMQTFPNNFENFIKLNKGHVIYKKAVKKILIKNNKVLGVTLSSNDILHANYVVAACDITQTFTNLLGVRVVGKAIITKIDSMKPSLSAFILYIGLDDKFKDSYSCGSNIWNLPCYDVDGIYSNLEKNNFEMSDVFFFRILPNKKTLLAFINAPYNSEIFWKHNKSKLAAKLLNKIERFIPNLKKHIIFSDAATPLTLHRYTLNYKGAAYGWAFTPDQVFDPDFSLKSFIDGLYLTGHWTTRAQGIPGVAYLGRSTANLILKDIQ